MDANTDAGETVQSEKEYAELFDAAYRKITCPTCGNMVERPFKQVQPLQPNQKISGM